MSRSPSAAASPAGAAAPPADASVLPPAPAYETVFTNAKAGMDGADLDKVKRVVYEMSKDSAHFQNEQRKMAATETRIAKMRAAAAALSPVQLASNEAAVDARVAELEAARDVTRTWIHVDMDSFFYAVEEQHDPSLKGKPVAVGGMGMISTASYAARAYGVRSAMPGFIAVKLCPHLIFVPPNFERYRAASEKTRAVFAQYDPHFEAMSLDEAYLDVTEYCAAKGMDGAAVAAELRAAVTAATGGLTCSCGVACNKTLAKICSDKNKPNGQYVLPGSRDAVAAFVAALPVRKVPGVGRVTQHVLNAFGVEVCGDIMPRRGLLAALFSPTSMEFFLHCALGLGGTQHSEGPAEGEVGRKGISVERTFGKLSARGDLEAKAIELAGLLAADMAAEGLRGRTLTLKLKLTTFELRTRAVTLSSYISTADDIAAAALKLLRAELPVEIRLMGLRMSGFYEEARRERGQPSLEDVLQRRQRKRAAEGGEAEEGGERGKRGERLDGDDEVVHSSQVLSAGDEVELTLADWQQAGGGTSSGGSGGVEGGATAAAPLHLPTTLMDDLARRGRVEKDNATVRAQQQHPPLPPPPPPPPATWSCSVCTFENIKGSLLCEMCGTSKTGKRPVEERGGGRAKRRAGDPPGASILGFFAPKAPQETRDNV